METRIQFVQHMCTMLVLLMLFSLYLFWFRRCFSVTNTHTHTHTHTHTLANNLLLSYCMVDIN